MIMTVYIKHGTIALVKKNSGRKVKMNDIRNHQTLQRIVSKQHRVCKVNIEVCCHFAAVVLFQKTYHRELHKFMKELQLLKPVPSSNISKATGRCF